MSTASPSAAPASPPMVICLYRVAPGREEEFTALLRRHWPTLHRLGLVTDEPARHFRGAEQDGAPLFVELFTWSRDEGAALAHEHPEVMAVWEPMDRLTESRGGRPNMEFPHVAPFELGDAP